MPGESRLLFCCFMPADLNLCVSQFVIFVVMRIICSLVILQNFFVHSTLLIVLPFQAEELGRYFRNNMYPGEQSAVHTISCVVLA